MLVLDIVLIIAMGCMIVAMLAMKWRIDDLKEEYDKLFAKQAKLDEILIKHAAKLQQNVEKLEQNCPKQNMVATKKTHKLREEHS